MTGVLERDRTTLVVVDVQEAFRPAVEEFDALVQATAVLVQGARALGVPIIVTEQYPRGLGATVPEVIEHLLQGQPRLSKTVFSAAAADRALALERARGAGAHLTSVEMALLELCERAGTDEFKTIQGLIK